MDLPYIDGSDLSFPASSDTPGDIEVRRELLELPDGSEGVAFGDPDLTKDYFHLQGQNDLGMQEDCGLTACGDVLNQFGIHVTENDVVHDAVDNHCCEVIPGHFDSSGGTSVADQAQVLSDFNVPAHVQTEGSLGELAEHIAAGQGVIIEVNAGLLWEDPNYYEFGQPNHAITVERVSLDPATSAVNGIWVNDSGAGDYCRFLPPDHPALANWMKNDGMSVVTDISHV